MKSRIYILAIIAFLSFNRVYAQDPMFSQYYSSELYLNPALAGEEQDLFFSSNYRSQWNSIVLPYITSQISFVHPIYVNDLEERHLGGIGFSVWNDKAGASNFKTTGVNATFAYNVPLTNDNSQDLSFGLQVGVVQKTVDYTSLRWGEQYNPYIGFDVTQTPSEHELKSGTIYPDISFGAMYYFNPAKNYTHRKMSAYVGASAYHLNRPNESFADGVESRLPILYKLHGGLDIKVSTRSSISPNFLVMHQNEKYLYDLGFYWSYRVTSSAIKSIFARDLDLIVGSWYRVQDAAILSLGMGNKAYTLAFSYDYNTSDLRHLTKGRGAYEISLKIRRVKAHGRKRIATPRI